MSCWLPASPGPAYVWRLDRVPLWRGNHVSIGQLTEDFSRYSYLPRLRDPAVLLQAVANGLSLLTWEQDTFSYAESYDEESGRYRGLRAGQTFSINEGDGGLVVRPEVARRQMDAEAKAVQETAVGTPIAVAVDPATARTDCRCHSRRIYPPRLMQGATTGQSS